MEHDTAFDDFTALVFERVQVGAAEYGNKSFLRPPHELLQEVKEEAVDFVVWLGILDFNLARAAGYQGTFEQRIGDFLRRVQLAMGGNGRLDDDLALVASNGLSGFYMTDSLEEVEEPGRLN